jgi:CheY-like chemotaxis protein
MPQGGKLTIETANVYLDEAYARQHVDVLAGPYAMLAISDTGLGMDAETQAHIFEPFFTTKEQGHGIGLGLAVVHGIVHQSGGHIQVYSELGHGTIFKIYLPRIEAMAEPAKPEPISTTSGRGTETILLVEDEAMVRELAQRVLVSQGYNVLEAGDSVEAQLICAAYEESIHLLLTDVVIPGGMSGPQLVEKLILLHPEIKVLYMSGYTENAIIHYGVLDPGIAFLPKPFVPVELIRKVREVLDTGGAA